MHGSYRKLKKKKLICSSNVPNIQDNGFKTVLVYICNVVLIIDSNEALPKVWKKVLKVWNKYPDKFSARIISKNVCKIFIESCMIAVKMSTG